MKLPGRSLGVAAAVLCALSLCLIPSASTGARLMLAAAGPCDAPTNPIVCENSKPGTPRDSWFVESYYGDIEGFATQASVQPGERLDFKIKTPSTDYEVDILRIGYYGGAGARQITTLLPSVNLPQNQPQCAYQSNVGLVDCGNWAVSTSWQLPTTAVPGFYVANFIRNDGAGASQYPFVVRSDASHSEIVIQTSDQTWQAYNMYGDRPGINEYSLYGGGWPGSSDGRAYKVSYNRPHRQSGTASYLNAEYPLIRFMERNGYDVSYLTSVDINRNPGLLLNHKVYISSGHDEYVTGTQRTAIEQARAAGVHLMFLSGNEMFWKTRFENAITAGNAAHRTLVSYKETKVNAKIDPHPEWTGTWRDPTASPPSDGGRPENALTGQLFMINGYRADAIQVPAQYGRNRFWRNTSIATATTTTTLPVGTLGYEWDVDPDNGHRPAGAVPLSETTVTVGPEQLLRDHGNVYGSGPATHKMTLYRDQQSRSLVFGSGTVQWAWGLDGDHIYPYGAPPNAPTSSIMQQATVNLLADMGSQPRTLMPGIQPATGATDTTGPTVNVGSPAAGSTVPAGTPRTITGTATDAGGGRIGAVEVSVDNGATWRRATGTDTWTYPWTPSVLGPTTIRVRASDDSANLGAVRTVNLTVGAQQCPCTLFGNATPSIVDALDTSAVELGTKFSTSVNATVTGVRFYKSSANTGTHTGSLWTTSGQRLATGTFSGESASGWQTLNLATPIQIRAGQTYIVSYTTTSGHYSVDPGYFNSKGAGIVPLTAPATGAVTGGNGVFRYGLGFPDSSHNGGNYWVDVVITTDTADNTPPTISSVSPASGATGAYLDGNVTTTFNEGVDPASVQFALRQGSTTVPGVVRTDDNVATFAPTNLLAPNTSYTATVHATDGFGNPLAAPLTWSFTTGTAMTPCPCTIFRGANPLVEDVPDPNDVELGVKFSASVNATVTGVRFYKSSANTGTHTGSLWTATGQRLATGTFTGETASGWQTLTFATPVQIQGGRTYLVSYRAPNGHYSVDAAYFATTGAGRGVVTAPSSPAAGGQGVYVYGGGFPSSTHNSNNYWVDVVVNTAGADNTPPTVTSTEPPAGANNVSVGTGVTAYFSEPVDPGTVQFSLSGNGSGIAGSTQVAPDGRSAIFVSNSSLPASTQITASVRGNDLQGNVMAAAHVWTFTTGALGACPCSLFRPTDVPAASAVDSPVELGMRVRPSRDGTVSGVRFYQTEGDTGTHTGSLWSPAGQLLATGTFTGESASGWQTLTFASPVAVTSGTTYVVSYHTGAGRYGHTGGYFTADRTNGPLTAPASTEIAGNGVYRYGNGGAFPTDTYNAANYWVDIVFN
ncbi:Ig-like domain-containing protein [Herbihabitans rhizosphaerae]|uniref:Ig-like domain-containing protein n=1 Tax=Herbihabitans rhizosphaerae TaxID=1872711 RepID=A0A4Q7KW77_9PSEU|nr:DUF4082 domain-containing protein [Herbihabitans rhizosphaerae]RZS40925.1 Ig-like domain-containing protein [Herbihabitans rhizosphaerae]